MKKLWILVSIFLVMLTTTGCTGDKPAILFNKYPITEDTVMGYGNLFKPNTRIYYLVLIPEKIHSRYIFLQIIKKDNKEGRLGYKMFYGKTVRLKDEHVNYYDDYIVIGEPGAYVMQVFSKDNPQKVYALGQFFVQE